MFGVGSNVAGQLGDGTGISTLTPSRVNISIDVSNFTLSFSSYYGFAITTSGELYGFGQNNMMHQLGLNNTVRQLSPVYVMSNAIKVVAGNSFTLVMTSNGSLFGFGKNNVFIEHLINFQKGQLGNGGSTTVELPTKNPYLDNIIDISTGYEFSLVLHSNRTAFGFGSSSVNELII
jgi:alpha-tubulin suppressor-like RCC1 family protein